MSDSQKIDAYIDSLADWQKQICTKARELIHVAEPDITEEVKYTFRPYFTYNGHVCALLATKKHVNIFIYDPIAPDPAGIINQGHENKTARAIQVPKDTFPDEEAFVRLIQTIVASNKKGGWRKLRQQN